MILIGSRAIKTQNPTFPRGDKSDWDYVSNDALITSLMKDSGKDVHTSPEVFNLLRPYCQVDDTLGFIPSLPALYTLKISHSFWDHPRGSWFKHTKDLIWFQNQGVEFIPELYKELYRYWEKEKGKKKAYLNVSNEAFFTSAVDRKYVHDDLHMVMAYYDKPLYMACKEDQSKALLKRSLFEALSSEDKNRLAREEIYVTALERFLIPSDFSNSIKEGTTPVLAYQRALKLLVTSMTAGWFPLHILLNLKDLQSPDIDYVAKFKEGEHKCRLVTSL